MNSTPEDKEKRRKALERRKKDKQKRRNPIAGDYNRFRHKVLELDTESKRKGARNWRLDIDKEIDDA
jgi:hypothetical protein